MERGLNKLPSPISVHSNGPLENISNFGLMNMKVQIKCVIYSDISKLCSYFYQQNDKFQSIRMSSWSR